VPPRASASSPALPSTEEWLEPDEEVIPLVAAGPAWARLIGSAGEVLLRGERYDLGRSSAGAGLHDDPYVAALHASFSPRPGGGLLRPLDGTNGVYVRLRDKHELVDGDCFSIGHQVFQFDALSAFSSPATHAPDHEGKVRLYTSAPTTPWGRLRQLTPAGTGDVYHLARGEFTLGRTDGDHLFADDAEVDLRHVVLRHNGGRPLLVDLGSESGTFVRVRSDKILVPGDIVRLGERLFRFEQA
jgi:pSer/pThr/pTyr-binding forkhead associated (FHA) protein